MNAADHGIQLADTRRKGGDKGGEMRRRHALY
jgi:hypothetical protein